MEKAIEAEQAQTGQTLTFNSFAEFYPFYINEHSNPTCRRLHFVGSSIILVMLGYIIISSTWSLIWTLPLIGYGFAWVGHFVFEKNRPATFKYPVYSLMGDWVMFKDILFRKIAW